MKGKRYVINTTVRIEDEQAATINKLVETTGLSRSSVIRQLLSIAVGKQKKIVYRHPTVLSDDDKQLILGIYDRQAAIINELNRIGNNINTRRKNYNADRKLIVNKIEHYQKLKEKGNGYDKALSDKELERLNKELKEYDDKTATFIQADEWERFDVIRKELYRISEEMERRMTW